MYNKAWIDMYEKKKQQKNKMAKKHTEKSLVIIGYQENIKQTMALG